MWEIPTKVFVIITFCEFVFCADKRRYIDKTSTIQLYLTLFQEHSVINRNIKPNGSDSCKKWR
nr:MAG TPA_asm: hypothetical protein [Caudoviricetes sp.]